MSIGVFFDEPDGPAPFDLAVFDQDLVWLDEQGRVYRIAAIGRLERRRLARWLRANVRHFYADVLRVQLVRTAVSLDDAHSEGRGHDVHAGRGRPGPSQAGGGDGGPVLPELVFLSAGQWLEATPLMRRLRRWWWP